ncbi:hypothetical protein V0288_03190 [Pannus brasiliensis CCIBt3594]|uniref:Antitoxin VbhA domain-containing protein n=1 Tax=Pannus brasiliensis CCIBt3594 TaxID=1427578 RepID=A0AAW9QE94_9CHRO
MKVEHPNELPITEAEAKELEHLKKTIERAIEDGVITRAEFETIKGSIFRQGIISASQLNREISLYRQLVADKLGTGEIFAEPPQ